MTTAHIAQGLAGLGRGGDSMLIHIQPREVAGLQALAKAHGGSLTINPETGLPEAGFLGDVLGTIAPIAAGFALGPGGFGLFNSALTAGLAVGAGAYALTGDPMKALTAGLGGAGGFGLGSNVAEFGKDALIKEAPKVAETTGIGFGAAAEPSLTGGITGLGIGAEPASLAIPQDTSSLLSSIAPQNTVSAVPTSAAPTSGWGNTGAGVGRMFGSGPGEGLGAYKDFVTGRGGSIWQDAATVGLPILSAVGKQQEAQTLPVADEGYQMNYEGPYSYPDRGRRMPTPEEQQAMITAGSPEFSYFSDVNPNPGFVRAGYADGGSITSGGIRDLYGSPDDQLNGAVLSQDGYGLGRLQRLSDGGEAYAEGGPIAFNLGGATTPYVQDPAVAASYAVPPANLTAQQPSIQNQLNMATTDPLGRTTGTMGGMGGKGGVMGMGYQNMWGGRRQTSQHPALMGLGGIGSLGNMPFGFRPAQAQPL